MDYYQTLGIQPNATDNEIKKAWRELSFKYHPDKNVNSTEHQKKENEKKIKELNEAWETLRDPVLRRQYDNRNANPFQHFFGDIFKQQHSQPNGFRNPYHTQPMMNPMMNIFDIINEIHNQHGQQGEPIIFTTMYEGTHMNQPTHLNQQTHMNQQTHPNQTNSNTSHNVVIQPIEIKLDLTLEQSFTGTQLPIMLEREIKNGSTVYREQERIYITITSGIDRDEIIIIPEKGNEVNGIKGDVKVQIILKHHEVFERRGLNLIYKHTISFKESIVGFDFVLNYIDATTFKVKSSRGNIIQNLEEKTIKGKGFTRDGSIGDLVIVFKVVSPKTLSEEQIESFEAVL